MGGSQGVRPRRGERCYSFFRKEQGYQPNGVIDYVDWSNQSVCVKWHSDQNNKAEEKDYDFSELEGNWAAAQFGGTWYLT